MQGSPPATTNNITGVNTLISPSLINADDFLWLIYSGLGADPQIYWAQHPKKGGWTAAQPIAGASTNNALAAGIYNGMLTVVYAGASTVAGRVFVSQYYPSEGDSGSWCPVAQISADPGFMPRSMASVIGGTFVCGELGNTPGALMLLTDTGLVRMPDVPVTGLPVGPVNIVNINNQLWASFVVEFPAPPGIYLTTLTDIETAPVWEVPKMVNIIGGGPLATSASMAVHAVTVDGLSVQNLIVATLTAPDGFIQYTSGLLPTP